MSFITRAPAAAAHAAETARLKAQEATGQGAGATGDAVTTQDKLSKGLSGAGASAREAIGMAKRGMNTVIEKIDPSTLADLIVKATALQEMTNKSLRTKGSPYRIAEISISASIPPAVSFAISRIGDEPEHVDGEVISSSDLVGRIVESGDLVLSLDGTTVDQAAVEPPAPEGARGAMPPSGISTERG